MPYLRSLAVIGTAIGLLQGCATRAPSLEADEAVQRSASGETARVRIVSVEASHSTSLLSRPLHTLRASLFDTPLCEGERSLASVRSAGLLRGGTRTRLGIPGDIYPDHSFEELLLPANEDMFLIFESSETNQSDHFADPQSETSFCSLPLDLRLEADKDYELSFSLKPASRCEVRVLEFQPIAGGGSSRVEIMRAENATSPMTSECRILIGNRSRSRTPPSRWIF